MIMVKNIYVTILIICSLCFIGNANGGVALVYNGKVAAKGAAEAVTKVVAQLNGMSVKYFDSLEKLPLLLDEADICIIGGTKDDLTPFLDEIKNNPGISSSLSKWIEDGGRFVGICGGSYIAAGWEEGDANTTRTIKGLGLLPVLSQDWSKQTCSQIIPVTWKGGKRAIYYLNGPAFTESNSSNIKILSRYYEGEKEGKIAALAYKSGKGMVVVFGPHPEADKTWLIDTPVPLNASSWASTNDIAVDMLQASFF